MHREGHLGISLLIFSPIAYILFIFDQYYIGYIGISIIIFFSMFPDKDLDIEILTHRGLTHTIWFALVFGFVFSLIGVYLSIGEYPLFESIGVVTFLFLTGFVTVGSHILGDALTPMGIRPFKPIDNTKYTLNLFRASNQTANQVFLFIGLGTISVSGLVGMEYLETSLSQQILIGMLLLILPITIIFGTYKYGRTASVIVWN